MSIVYADPHMLVARMLRRCVRTPEGCWMFTGSTNSRGYAQVGSGKSSRSILGHQLVLLAAGVEVPPGHNIDHVCHDSHLCRLATECPHRRCVNPAHLAVVTVAANTARRWERNVCPEGHRLTWRRNRRQRECRECQNAPRRKLSGRTSSDYWKAQREKRAT